jgi:hypothetical protein
MRKIQVVSKNGKEESPEFGTEEDGVASYLEVPDDLTAIKTSVHDGKNGTYLCSIGLISATGKTNFSTCQFDHI